MLVMLLMVMLLIMIGEFCGNVVILVILMVIE